MSKRPGELFIANDSKKPKISNLDSTFWDDDVDDDCFGEIASKMLEQDATRCTQTSQENSSILPSYDSFRPNIPFASTQDTHAPIFKEPHENGNRNNDGVKELEMKITFLQQKYEAKEGEVAILRAQMQKIKSDTMEDQNKKQKEYLEYTTLREKEMKRIKAELEFKNLEIANLKEKILEISKAVPNIYNRKPKNVNFSAMGDSSRRVNNSRKIEKGIYISILQDPDFPLLSKFPSNFFTSHLPEVHAVQIKVNQYGRNRVPYIHNQMGQEFAIPSGPKIKMKIDKVEVGLEYIYPEILKIIGSDIDQINSEDFKPVLVKILCVSIQLLEYLKQYLEILEKHYRTEDIEQLDKTFLENNPVECTCEGEEKNMNCEIGVRAGKTVQLIAELLPCSTYLSDYILLGKSIELDENLSKNLSCLKLVGKNNHYFILLDDIIRKIFFLRKTGVCGSFLNSVGLLLLNISKHNLHDNSFPLFCALTGSLLYTRPPLDVLHKLLIVVKNCSKLKHFVEYLCQKPDSKKITTDKKRKMHYFMEESCKFTLFVALLHKNLLNIEDEVVSLDIAVNVISFIYNIFMMNPFWMHDQQKDQCICLEQLYQLAVGILYKILLQYRRNKYTQLKDTYISVFKYGVKILRLLTFNSYDLMEKNVETHSKYKAICRGLLELETDLNLSEIINDLQKQCLSDEVPIVGSECLQLL